MSFKEMSDLFNFNSMCLIFATGLLFATANAVSEVAVVDAPKSTSDNGGLLSGVKIVRDSNSLFSCWSCNATEEADGCFNLTADFRAEKNNQVMQQCLPNEQYCRVERVWYIFGMNKTEFNFSIQRHCSPTCNSHCLIMGDRTKIYSCSTCCQETLCNIGSSAKGSQVIPVFKENFSLVLSIFISYQMVLSRCRMRWWMSDPGFI